MTAGLDRPPESAAGAGRGRPAPARAASPAGSTACSTATTAGLVPGHGASRARPASTSPATTCAASTGTSPPACSEPHVRETIADRELETWVLVDLSASLDFGTAGCEKRDLALAAAAAVGFLTPRTGNRLGAVLVGPTDGATVPARTGQRPPAGACSTASPRRPADAGGAADLAGALRRAGAAQPPPGPGRVISDFLGARRAGSGRCAGWPRATRSWPSRSSTPASSSCPTSACSSWSTPRPASRARCRPLGRAARALRRGRRRPAGDDRRTQIRGAGADHLRAAHRPRLAARPRPLRVVAPRAARGAHAEASADGESSDVDRRVTYGRGAMPSGCWLVVWPSSASPIVVPCSCARRTYAVGSPTSTCSTRRPAAPGWRRHLPAVAFLPALHRAGGRPRRAREPSTVPGAGHDHPGHRHVAVDAGHRRRAQAGSTPPRRRPPVPRHHPAEINVGLVSFNGSPRAQVPPTTDHASVKQGIDGLELGGHGHRRGDLHQPRRHRPPSRTRGRDEPAPARIVLMSDGKTTIGRAERVGAPRPPSTPACRCRPSPSAPTTG